MVDVKMPPWTRFHHLPCLHEMSARRQLERIRACPCYHCSVVLKPWQLDVGGRDVRGEFELPTGHGRVECKGIIIMTLIRESLAVTIVYQSTAAYFDAGLEVVLLHCVCQANEPNCFGGVELVAKVLGLVRRPEPGMWWIALQQEVAVSSMIGPVGLLVLANCAPQLLNDIPATNPNAYVCEVDNLPASNTPSMTLSASVSTSTSPTISVSISVTNTKSVTPSMQPTALHSAEPTGSSLCVPGWYYFDDAQGETERASHWDCLQAP
jgi:hypothetical protein